MLKFGIKFDFFSKHKEEDWEMFCSKCHDEYEFTLFMRNGKRYNTCNYCYKPCKIVGCEVSCYGRNTFCREHKLKKDVPIICEYCLHTLNSKHILKTHQSSAKYCLEIQRELADDYNDYMEMEIEC